MIPMHACMHAQSKESQQNLWPWRISVEDISSEECNLYYIILHYIARSHISVEAITVVILKNVNLYTISQVI